MKWQTTVAQIAYNILVCLLVAIFYALYVPFRSEEHTSELQSQR